MRNITKSTVKASKYLKGSKQKIVKERTYKIRADVNRKKEETNEWTSLTWTHACHSDTTKSNESYNK